MSWSIAAPFPAWWSCGSKWEGDFVANQRADGLIIASPDRCQQPTRSQPADRMLHPSIPGWVLVPIAPHTLSNRPIVLSDATEVAIEIVSWPRCQRQFRHAVPGLTAPRRPDYSCSDPSTVCGSCTRVGWSYFATLAQKSCTGTKGDPDQWRSEADLHCATSSSFKELDA
jgi:NAD+ kinase